MTFDDILDNAAYDAGDDSAEYRAAALRWLNATRGYIRISGTWRSAFRESVDVSTAVSTPTVALVDGSSNLYEGVYGQYIYNTTNDTTLVLDTQASLRSADPDRATTGPPTWWADAGFNSSGQRLISLFPVPEAVYTLNFSGYMRLTDISSSATTLSEDPYFGPVLNWMSTLMAGLRYHHNLNNNESGEQILISQRMFENEIKRQKLADSLTPSAVISGRNIRGRGSRVPVGRLDPAHFRN